MDWEQPIFSMLAGRMKGQQSVDSAVSPSTCSGGATSPTAVTSDAESGIFSVECELCVEHESELDWYCGTEQKLICSLCVTAGSCRGHSVTPAAARVTAVRVSARLLAHAQRLNLSN